jgi:hypothetical protein
MLKVQICGVVFDSSPCTPMQCRDNESGWWLPQDVMSCQVGSGDAPSIAKAFEKVREIVIDNTCTSWVCRCCTSRQREVE